MRDKEKIIFYKETFERLEKIKEDLIARIHYRF